MTMIPPITNHDGIVNWNQPKDIRTAPMDDTHVLLTREQLAGLAEYSRSVPDGVYPGKCWKARHIVGGISEWYLKWYEETGHPRYCNVEVRKVVIGKLKEAA